MTVPDRTCVVCERPSRERLCSTGCRGEAAYERERNLRRLRLLRRTDAAAETRDLVERNAALNDALLPSAVTDRGPTRVTQEV